jgi:hypothetical protein
MSKPTGEEIIKLLIELLADQKGVAISYRIGDSEKIYTTEKKKTKG